MAKVLIAFASMSGNTEDIADLLKVSIEPFEHTIDFLEIEDMAADVLLNYDGILIGSYTWGDGDLPYEVEDFYDELPDIDLSGKVVAVFGSGDTAYPLFCEAVDILEKRVKECGAHIPVEGLKIEFTPEGEDVERCADFAIKFATSLGES